MQWYEKLIDNLDNKESYSHKELVDELRELKPDLTNNAYHWALSGLVREGKLIRRGYDTYCPPDGKLRIEYQPNYSEASLNISEEIQKKYPYVQFTVFETILMNEFLNHLIANNTIFIQAEKECGIFIFRFLQESGYRNLMYKPDARDFNLYWTKDCIVITDLISEAPMRANIPYKILLEKMLVDILADKRIASAFSKAELPDIYEQAKSKYNIDKVRMYRYARRRNREDELKKYMGD